MVNGEFSIGRIEASACKIGNNVGRIGVVGKLSVEQIQRSGSEMLNVSGELCRSIVDLCVQRSLDFSNNILIVYIEYAIV